MTPSFIVQKSTALLCRFSIPILLLFMLASCQGYVQAIDTPIDIAKDEALNVQTQADFLIGGADQRFANAYSQTTLLAGGLSDEMFFDLRVPNATFITFQNIDLGDPQNDNNSVSNALTAMGSYRFTADALVERVSKITFTDTAARGRMLFWGNFHGGVSRHLYAAYIGLRPRQGGGVVDGGPFIPSTAMHDSALAKLNRALTFAQTAYAVRIVNSMIAKIHLIEGRYAEARSAALLGLRSSDAPYQARYSAQTISNEWWANAGALAGSGQPAGTPTGRPQFVPSPRYAAYVAAERAEAGRIPVSPSRVSSGLTYQMQLKFIEPGSPLDLVSWQETSLILAETDLRISNDAQSALTRVNAVRAAVPIPATLTTGLAARTTTNLDSIYIERDKQLFGTGMRLCDQRRFNRWHLGAETWWVLPFTLPERTTNPNLPPN
jgi:hypothetical protein